jgi:hypothetical protein
MPARPTPLHAAALAAALCAPATALADPPAVALQVSNPGLAGCPDAAGLAREINAVLAREATSETPPAGPHATIHVDFSATPAGLQATLSLAGPDGLSLGSRTIRRPGRSCPSLAGPAAIVGALLVDVARTQISLVLPPAPEPPPPAALAPPAEIAPPPAALPPRAASVRGEVAAAALAGLLPGVSGGARSELRTRGIGGDARPWPAWVVGRVDVFPAGSTAGEGPGGAFSAWAAGAGLCAPVIEGKSIEIEGCALAAAGVLRAVGTGARVVRESVSLLALIEADAAIRLRIAGPFWVRAAAGVAAGKKPGSFSFDRTAEPLVIHRPWPVALTGTLGISVGE